MPGNSTAHISAPPWTPGNTEGYHSSPPAWLGPGWTDSIPTPPAHSGGSSSSWWERLVNLVAGIWRAIFG